MGRHKSMLNLERDYSAYNLVAREDAVANISRMTSRMRYQLYSALLAAVNYLVPTPARSNCPQESVKHRID